MAGRWQTRERVATNPRVSFTFLEVILVKNHGGKKPTKYIEENIPCRKGSTERKI